MSCRTAKDENSLTIYAAASTNHIMKELAQLYQQKTDQKVLISFASSSTLARQIEYGAKADIYLSANTKWMDYIQKKIKLIKRDTLLKNSLVLVTSKRKIPKVEMRKGFDFASSFKGRLALGDPIHVPAGIYAKEALITLGWWPSVKFRLVKAIDVRSALRFVERGECELGIVYHTDALSSKKVLQLARFPQQSYTPIEYPIALLSSDKSTRAFYQFLFSPQAQKVYLKYGFKSPESNP